jgi:hypothetical protein
MTSIAHSKNIIKFITDFLSEHGSEELAEMWNEEDNMKAFTTLLVKAAKAVKKNSSDKKIKDPHKPKGKRSAYIIFCTKKREEAKKLLNPDAKATEVTSKLGQMWNELKNSKKTADKKMFQLCEQEAAEDKARYDEDMKDYVPPSDDELIASKGKGSKKKSDPNAPKGKKSAYIFFCSDNRDAAKSEIGTDGKATDVTKLLATWWNELKADEDRSDELEKYNKMAADDKIRYEQETNGVEETSESKKIKGKKNKSQIDEGKSDEESEPKKGKKIKSDDKPQISKKTNGYTYFCKTNRASVKEDNPEMSATEITKELARQWKELDEDEQNEWKEAMTTV